MHCDIHFHRNLQCYKLRTKSWWFDCVLMLGKPTKWCAIHEYENISSQLKRGKACCVCRITKHDDPHFVAMWFWLIQRYRFSCIGIKLFPISSYPISSMQQPVTISRIKTIFERKWLFTYPKIRKMACIWPSRGAARNRSNIIHHCRSLASSSSAIWCSVIHLVRTHTVVLTMDVVCW